MIKRTLIVVAACLAFASLHAQSLLTSRNTSYYTYYYKIKETEAREIHQVGMAHMDERFFHTLIDSVPSSSPYKPALPPGHYLRTYTLDNQLHYQVATISTCEIRLLKNGEDLKIQVFDPQGNPVEPESIELKRKEVKWDDETQAYG